MVCGVTLASGVVYRWAAIGGGAVGRSRPIDNDTARPPAMGKWNYSNSNLYK